MYEYIKGILTKITAKYIVVETAGIGYLLHVANPYAYSGKMNQEVQVYLHQVVREDAHLLYGFATEEEKQLFLNLISVSGIGPVSALAIIAADDNAGLVQAIESKNITYLTKFPKIGKKTAQQMVLDLEGKINLNPPSASDGFDESLLINTRRIILNSPVSWSNPNGMDLIAAFHRCRHRNER